MDYKLFESMFGPVSKEPLWHDENALKNPYYKKNPLYYDSSFGYTTNFPGMLKHEYVSGGLEKVPNGYENVFMELNSTFGQDTSKWLRDNVEKLSPRQMKQIINWISFSNNKRATQESNARDTSQSGRLPQE